jgi:predicted AlkP superfamily pyrophosphatase or phosphodiesterase
MKNHRLRAKLSLAWPVLLLIFTLVVPQTRAQAPTPASASHSSKSLPKPKLVVLLVVDQMRADYVDKFLGQWRGGLRRLVEEGAWFRDAAYPYSVTETCVGHATISTGALPATHAMVANAWFDRETQKMTTCTADPDAKNVGYAGAAAKGGDSAWRMQLPAFAEELKFQTNGATRVVTFSLKARAAITMAGHKADAVTWMDLDNGGLVTSSVYPAAPFIEAYAKAHPVKQDYGKTWTPSLPESAYWYEEKTPGAVPPEGWGLTFPHPLRGQTGGSEPDAAFYDQWASSPYADTYLTRLAETAVDSLGLGKGSGIDFLGVSYSPLDYVGHALGPRSHEVQDILVRLDQDLGELFAHLDQKIGKGNYVVAFSADHGVAPVQEDLEKAGFDAGSVHLPELRERLEKALEPFNLGRPAVARVYGADVYFAPGVYDKLKQDAKAMRAVTETILSQPGVAEVFPAEQLENRPATQSPSLSALANNYFPGRSGDLFIVNKPYWILDGTPTGKTRSYGAGHGTLYSYDQRVPVLFMGSGIQQGEYLSEATPADIAPTLAVLCGITLASRDGHVLAEALAKPGAKHSGSPLPASATLPQVPKP